MFIAFEGPDNVGKTTSAVSLNNDGAHLYNVTKAMHERMRQDIANQNGLVVAYDRIDWFTHMVYRLAMPERDWNDDRPRTVFAMPDTHLVVKMHAPELAHLIDDELYETGKLALVNPMYFYFADFFMALNRTRDYELFKSVSIVEVRNDRQEGTFTQSLKAFDSASVLWAGEPVESDEALLEFLRHVDHHTL